MDSPERKPNAELAYKVLDQIDADPSSWDQGTWISETKSCGTVACFAGWAATLGGCEPIFGEWAPYGTDAFRNDRGVTLPSGGRTSVRDAAQNVLGISEDAALDLFSGSNDRDDLGHYVLEIFGDRPRPADRTSKKG